VGSFAGLVLRNAAHGSWSDQSSQVGLSPAKDDASVRKPPSSAASLGQPARSGLGAWDVVEVEFGKLPRGGSFRYLVSAARKNYDHPEILGCRAPVKLKRFIEIALRHSTCSSCR